MHSIAGIVEVTLQKLEKTARLRNHKLTYIWLGCMIQELLAMNFIGTKLPSLLMACLINFVMAALLGT